MTDAATGAPLEQFTLTVYLTTDQGTSHAEQQVSSATGNYLVEVDQKVTSFSLEFRQPGYLSVNTEPKSPGDGDQREDIPLLKGILSEVGGRLTVPGYRETDQLAGRAVHRADRFGSRAGHSQSRATRRRKKSG